MEAARNMQNYHRLFWASQERYDKLVSLSSSGGAVVFKNGGNPEDSDSVFEVAEAFADLHRNGEADVVSQIDSGIDVGAQARPRAGSCSNVGASSISEQNGVKHEQSSSPSRSKKHGSSSPNLLRRHKKESNKPETSLNGQSKFTTDKTATGQNKSNHEKSANNSANKSVGEKTSSVSGKAGNEKSSNSSSNALSAAQAHVFAVPRPPQQRKGARRPLQLDSLVINKTSSTGSLLGATSSVMSPSPTVTTPTAVDIASRRTQSR